MTLKLVSLFAPALLDKLHKLYSLDFDQCNSEEKEVLALIVGEYANTNAKLQQYTGRNGWEINRLLSGLTSQGFLISTSNGRWTTYEPNQLFISQTSPQINLSAKDLINSKNKVNSQINSQIKERIQQDVNLTEDQKKILIAMQTHPTSPLSELSNLTGLTVSAIRYQREKMKEYVNTQRVGSNKAGRWEIRFLEE